MKTFDLNDKISAPVSKVAAYVPGEQPGTPDWVKLNTNEFPYPPSPRVREALMCELSDGCAKLRLYPDPVSRRLREAIAHHFCVPAEYVLAGNGSDDILNLAVRAFSDGDKKIVTIDPSYSLYPVLAKIEGSQLINIPFENGLEIPYEKIFSSGANIFFFTNPNAPTGAGFGREAVEKIAENFDGIVLVDEAYAPFSNFSAAELVRKYPNLIVVGTTSKGWALAGMRIGWAIADPALVDVLDRVRDSYNLDRLAQAAGVAAMGDDNYYREFRGKVIAEREETQKFFDSIGWDYVKSSSNFILFTPKDKSGKSSPAAAASLFDFLREKKILLRYFPKEKSVSSSIRLTVGTPEQMKAFKDAALEWSKK